ncbi:hypothetical protein VTJ49DRAFT_6964 [Mycothermus thermophilus]|uniref:Kelch repeat protein n=1 Tax=Humicola insolens TaxID=85995 RepID=A0ABR3VI97_HUMIN
MRRVPASYLVPVPRRPQIASRYANLHVCLSPSTPGEPEGQPHCLNSTLSIDISTSWTTKDVVIPTIHKPGPAKSNVVLWTDGAAGVFYSWGGRFPHGRNVTKTSSPELWKASEEGAWVSTPEAGFLIGGMNHGLMSSGYPGSATPVVGMLELDFKTTTVTNGTGGFSPFGDGSLIYGFAAYVPTFGANGLVMLFGGYATEPSGIADFSRSYGKPYDLETLTFFDPVSKKTYSQKATGTIPTTSRGDFCTAGFPTPDGGFDIFLSGGSGNNVNWNAHDAYILSLPGFFWTRVSDGSGTQMRRGRSCVRVGSRQVLVIGGYNGNATHPDPAPNGLPLFGMSTLTWKDAYDADAGEYDRAQSISDWYSSGELEKVQWSAVAPRAL